MWPIGWHEAAEPATSVCFEIERDQKERHSHVLGFVNVSNEADRDG